MSEYGILVKAEGMRQSVWVARGGTNRLRVHALRWQTVAGAQAYADQVTADPRNAHLDVRVVEF